MRITAKVIQNNTLSNINTNKLLQDKLSTQMATEKKINRPSDDPVVAIRALRLRTNVSQVTQYYEKNAPDAESWLKITEDALTTVSEVITDMIKQCSSGANEKLTSEDRNAILDALKSLRDEVYATGNADYAGRSVFTGYRTESTLKFTADTKKSYKITEEIGTNAIDTITHVKIGDLNSINDANFSDDGTDASKPVDYAGITEQNVEEMSVYRIRLSYSDVDRVSKDGMGPQITYYDEASNSFVPVKVKYDSNGDGNLDAESEVIPEVKSVDDIPNPYESVPKTGAILIKETGELLIGEDVYNELMSHKDNVNTTYDESSIHITYQKLGKG